MKIVAAEHTGMYFIEWEDGSRSDRFYNLDRATELMNRIKEGEDETKIRIGFKV